MFKLDGNLMNKYKDIWNKEYINIISILNLKFIDFILKEYNFNASEINNKISEIQNEKKIEKRIQIFLNNFFLNIFYSYIKENSVFFKYIVWNTIEKTNIMNNNKKWYLIEIEN